MLGAGNGFGIPNRESRWVIYPFTPKIELACAETSGIENPGFSAYLNFLSKTPKRTMCVSNSKWISGLDMGVLVRRTMEKKKGTRSCEQYRDKNGKLRYKGSKALKKHRSFDLVQIEVLIWVFLFPKYPKVVS